MHVAGDDPPHVRMAGDDLAQRRAIGVGQADRVPGRDAEQQRRMVHGHDGRRLAVLGQARVEPGQALGAQAALDAARIAWCRRRRGAAGRSAPRSGSRSPSRRRAPGSSRAAPSRSSWLPPSTWTGMASADEQLAHALVLVREPVLGEVAADEDRAGRGSSGGHVAHRVGEHPLGLRVVVVADVRVAELDEQERLGGAHAVVVSGRWRPTWPT